MNNVASDEITNYVYGQGLVAREVNVNDGTPTFTYFLVGDNENVVALADEDGEIADRYEYSTFGELTSHSGTDPNRILFSTEPNDQDSGLVYLRHRYYEPGTGRFVTKDPIYPFGVNRYAYCDNNPVGKIDPSGFVTTIHIYYTAGVPKYQSIEKLRKQNCIVKEIEIYHDDLGLSSEYIFYSLQTADYIIFRGHGDLSKSTNYTLGFGTGGNITEINMDDIRKALLRKSRVKTKLIFADACQGTHIHEDRFIKALLDRKVTYISSAISHQFSENTIEFLLNDIGGMDLVLNLYQINGTQYLNSPFQFDKVDKIYK